MLPEPGIRTANFRGKYHLVNFDASHNSSVCTCGGYNLFGALLSQHDPSCLVAPPGAFVHGWVKVVCDWQAQILAGSLRFFEADNNIWNLKVQISQLLQATAARQVACRVTARLLSTAVTKDTTC